MARHALHRRAKASSRSKSDAHLQSPCLRQGRDAQRVGAAGNGKADAGTCRQHERPDQEQLEGRGEAFGLHGETQQDAAQAQVVCFRQRVQARVDVGKAQQADGPGEEEEGADEQQQQARGLKHPGHRRLLP
jgi:hypothetical protein